MTKLRSAFRKFLEEYDKEYIEFLTSQGWLNPESGGPLRNLIEPLLQPYLKHESPISLENLEKSLSISSLAGTVCEALGRIPAALDWYRIGQYRYRGGRVYSRHINEDIPDISARDDAGGAQLETAICANRVGDHEHARQLYDWAAQNYDFPQSEIKFHEKVRQYMVLWQSLSYRAYALLCLERWEDALSVAEQGQSYIKKDRQVPATYTPVVLYPIIHALATYKIDPSDENRRKAIEMLSPQSVATRNHVGHLWGLFYLYNLRARHPELANPQPEELPLAERARQGAEACLNWMAQGGVTLDGTPESLKLLDENMRLVFRTLDNEDKRKQAVFLWGSYLGETIGKELAGGQWTMQGDHMFKFSLDWDMGEAELHLWAYRHVHEYVTSKTKVGLYQLWKETEQAYLDYGQAARYAE